MKLILAALCAGLFIGAVAHAKLPPLTDEQKAAAAAKADKDKAAKAKAADDLAKAQDKAVANYKKNKGGASMAPTKASAKAKK